MKTIHAIFKGNNHLGGFIHGKDYYLTVTGYCEKKFLWFYYRPSIQVKSLSDSNNFLDHKTVIAFLNNWDDIKIIS